MCIYSIDNETLEVKQNGEILGKLPDFPEIYKNIYKVAPPLEMGIDSDVVNVTLEGIMTCARCGVPNQIAYVADDHKD